ncbi:hypothetical protein B9Z55_006724 [Caenorhabditis nigoni]|uniref:RING-type domain-containing protein n=1 Tax=Caenorhabditis nigoni TaxID=1611254 RepID=A0A2G5V6A6_9PELO|nr:hypothetical protein B9Z55_006724 [Caenorhabditis nigoni]
MARKRKSARIAVSVLPKANYTIAENVKIAELKKQIARDETEFKTKLNKALSNLKFVKDKIQQNNMEYKLESDKKDEELTTLKTEKQALTNEIKHFKKCKDTKTTMRQIQAECMKAEQSRKKMLEAESLLRAEQEKKFKETKPWRQCEICTEEYTATGARSPRVMSCGHTFCLTCLESMTEFIYSRSDPQHQIRCPTDRKYMYCLNGDVSKLPINYLALHM